MDERRPTPLPPGVMPSSSNEDLYAQLQADSDAQKREEKLLGPVRGKYSVATCGRCVSRALLRTAAEPASFIEYESSA